MRKVTGMTDIDTQTTPFKAPRPKGEAKADVTDKAAKAIIDAEKARREAKTARLKQARAASEAGEAPADGAAPKKPKTQKAARTRRTRFSF